MRVIIVLFCLCIYSISLGQKRPIKFGKVSKEELKLSECEFYPDANAMILAEYADIYFLYNNDKGFQYKINGTTRKKIFNSDGIDEANIKIRLYDPVSGTGKEDLGTLRAFTYNLVDGKVQKDKLENKEKYETRINDYWVEVSFALPNVREGSVIEYTYSKISDYISNLQTWHFQNSIPTKYSDLQVTIPEYFTYQINQVGNIIPVATLEARKEEQFTLVSTGNISTGYVGGGGPTKRSNISSQSTFRSYVAKDILPVEEEPYMNNKPNIPSRLEFQLMKIDYPNSPPKTVAGSYDNLNSTLLNRSDFGSVLSRGNFAKDKIEEIGGLDPWEKANALYYWLRKNVIWNDVYTIYGDDAGRETYKKKEGSIADLNLSMVAVFREAGLVSYPIILGTRGHGIVHPTYPNYSDFNYVVAAVVLNDLIYFCDVSAALPFGRLPTRCLNGNGWMVSEDGGGWVNLKSNAELTTSVEINMNIENDKLISKVQETSHNYAAYNEYTSYKKLGHKDYQDNLAKSFSDWSVDGMEFESTGLQDTVTLDFVITKDFEEEDIIYLQPIFYGAFTENPFVREERMAPVDFPYKFKKVVFSKIQVPEGYIAEIPQPGLIKLPDGNGTFTFSASQFEDEITILSSLNLQKQDFGTDSYPFLRQFFQLMTEKNNEMVVLKKAK